MTDDLLSQFLIEGREQASAAESALAQLRRRPDDRQALEACFRAVHTLKGSAGILSLAPMARLLHEAEDRLVELRSRPAQAQDMALLTGALDQVDRWLEDLARGGRLSEDAEGAASSLLAGAAAAREPAQPAGRVAIRYEPRADAYFSGDDPLELIQAVPGLADLEISPREPWGDLSAYDPFVCNLRIEAVAHAPLAEVQAALRWVSDQVTLTEALAPESHEAEAVRTLRVDVARVDRLSELADEVVLAAGGWEGLIDQAAGLAGGGRLAQALRDQQAVQRRLAANLHGAVGRLRLAPLAPLFARFPRLVREIAQELGKQLDLETEPGSVELDRSLADGLFEPMLHVLRNAVDHGIEPAEARRATGKPERAKLRLSAQAEGDTVIIAVADDGAGLDVARLREAAVRRGVLTVEQAGDLSDADALDLVFLPGYSTRDTATQVSGRGVGMDAVRSAVARLGGEVRLLNRPGAGLEVRFILPLAVKLARILVVDCGGERYGLDMAEVLEAVRLGPDDIVPIRSGRGFLWRDQPLPLLALAQLAGLGDAAPPPATAARTVIVMRTPRGSLGLEVERVAGRLEAAVRPPVGLLAASPSISGTTLRADGGVLLILALGALLPWA